MRYTYMLVLPLLLALPQLAVGSSYSTQAAETRQDQQRQQCQKLALNSYAAGIDSRLGNGSCPAQLQPFPAEAPAVAAPTFGIGAAAAINSTHRITAQQVNNSSTAGSRHVSSDEAAEQQCAGEQGCSWQTFIVRFSQYKMLSEHKQALGGALAHLQQHWAWLERPNKAALQHPSDFALLSVAPTQLQALRSALQQVSGYRDMHLDRRIRGLLNWQPEGELASAFSNIPQQQQQQQLRAPPGRIRMHQEPESGRQGQQQQLGRSLLADAEQPTQQQPVEQQQQQGPPPAAGSSAGASQAADAADEDADSIWTVSKPPGRLTTKPTIGLDPRNPADREESLGREELRRSSRRRNLLASSWQRLFGGSSSSGDAGDGVLQQGQHQGQRKLGRSLTAGSDAVTVLLEAGKLWDQGYSGKGIRVGVFDTGIREGHPHIRHIKERTNWTHQQSLSDGLGHGSFVAGVIGSQDTACPGFAPDVELYTFKVFTDDQVSYTSWFLDAFNYAIASKLHVINLSIGGPDFLDAPFVEKVWEVTSNGLIMISAIGNDGPLYGTLNNPADQPDVIGVGGIDNDNNIASFSSRGMTTWELPAGTGRIKPDVMAYAKDVTGSKITAGCRSLSGTSVASPVVAGAVCLLASTLPEEKRWMLNPATMKQALVEGAVRLPQLNMHEQGNGRINLPASQAILANYTPRASLIPPAIHLADCPYMWPHCKQPLYAHALPVVLNATVVNGMANTGYFEGPPVYEGLDEGGKMLHVTFKYSDVLWPWSGYLAVYIQVSPAAETFSGNATGRITFTITSPGLLGAESKTPQTSKVVVPVSAVIKPTPPREQRIVWDVLHSIKYPPGYVPRDNLDIKSDVLDWHGDHPYTNYHEAYDALRNAGFSVELLASPASCFDPANYGGYLVLDAEEEWYKEEVDALASAVKEHGMSLVVFAEWYHEESLKQMKFFDDNTRSWWTPITGGANVPALNELLAPHGITLGERILQGSTSLGKHTLQVAYGSNIAAFPAGGHLHVSHLTDVAGKGAGVPGNYAAFGVAPSGKGKVAVFSDTNCLDSSHNTGPCFDFLVALFQQLLQGKDAGLTPADKLQATPFKAAGFTTPPQRRADVNFTQYSWVLQHPHACHMSAPCQFRQPSDCPAGDAWKQKHPKAAAAAAAPGAASTGSSSEGAAQQQPGKDEDVSNTQARKHQGTESPSPAQQQPEQQQQQQQGDKPGAEPQEQQPAAKQEEAPAAAKEEPKEQQQPAAATDDTSTTNKQQQEPSRGSEPPAAAPPAATPAEEPAEEQQKQQQTAEREAEKLQQLTDDASKQPQQQDADKAGKPSSSSSSDEEEEQGHRAQHYAKEQEQVQQGQRKAFISQAVTLATFICIAGVIGIVVLWSMRTSNGGLGRGKWGRRWGYAPVGRRSPSPLDV